MKSFLRVGSALAALFLATAPLGAQTRPQLGSPDFKPSPDSPVGWRGDGTGRYPGATPPMQWSRRVSGITTRLVCQADKPTGSPSSDAQPLEYFTIKEYLVAGPFSVEDPVKDMDKDFLGGEATIEPAKGAKAGDAIWKTVRVAIDNQSRHDHNEGTIGNLNVDFLDCFGTINPGSGKTCTLEGDFRNKLAYVHTYIHAPAEGKARLSIPYGGTAARYWLNGKPANLNPKDQNKTFDVTLNKGWNRLLIKVSAADGITINYDKRWLSGWRVAAYLQPSGPVAYETQNVGWMTRMTGRSTSAPIVVGDRIFIGANISDLLCIDKKTGKVLWLRSSSPYDAMDAEQRAAVPEIKEKIEPLLAKLDALNTEVVAAINAQVSPQGMNSDQQTTMDRKLKEKSDVERKIHETFYSFDKKKYPPLHGNEVSSTNATPVSDGQFVYWMCGGGSKGPGADVISCFDLSGNRVWAWYEAIGAVEHGTHLTPTLADGKLIFGAVSNLVALDAKTGKELWRNTKCDWDGQYSAGTFPIPMLADGQRVIVTPKNIIRLSDGVDLGPHGLANSGSYSFVVQDGLLINPHRFNGWDKPPVFMVGKLPPAATKINKKIESVVQLDGKDVELPGRGGECLIASPLCIDGIVYSVNTGAGISAVDIATKALLYRQWLDGYSRYNRYVFGVCASPTLAGNNIYVVDDAGYTHILQPGKQLKELGRNLLENIHQSGGGGNPCRQESFYTSPVFEGKAMYLRGEEYLYCIGGI